MAATITQLAAQVDELLRALGDAPQHPTNPPVTVHPGYGPECASGWHGECTDPAGITCKCPCHWPGAPAAQDNRNERAVRAPERAQRTRPGADGEPVPFVALEALKTSIGGHGVRWVPVADRPHGPWATVLDGAADAQLTGEPRWIRPELPTPESMADHRVITVDRSGSYFSACGSVRVSAGLLSRTGAIDLEYAKKVGGFFLIIPFDWKHSAWMPHPLGRITEREQWWITAPHLMLLAKLARQGYIEMPTILDSWTGPVKDTLFRKFSVDVKRERAYLRNEGRADDYVTHKRLASIALRLLWSSEDTKSPFWRPDWSIAIRAEAAVRHWAKAFSACDSGELLLELGTVDEAAFIAPADAGPEWVPAGYVLGTAFGEVKQKDNRPGVEWLESRDATLRGRRANG